MKLLPHYQPYSFVFHQIVVDAKKKTTGCYKTAIRTMNLVKERFDEYNDRFNHNALGSLKSVRFHKTDAGHRQIADHLKALYSFGSSPFSKLYQILTTTPNGEEITSCPLCELDLIGSLDHIVPRAAMPEFSTHPLNLIPSCTKCNAKKNANWRVGKQYKYINPYIDDFFDKEFLRIIVNWNNNKPFITYEIFQGNNVSDNEFKKISFHFHDMELCKRYASRTYNELASIANSIRSRMGKNNELEIRASLRREGKTLLANNGKSYWLGLLKLECASNSRLFSYILNYPLTP